MFQEITNEVELCNFALLKINQGSISDINEGSLHANKCLISYTQTRQKLLSLYTWQFAIDRKSLRVLHTKDRLEEETDQQYNDRVSSFELLGWRNAYDVNVGSRCLRLCSVYGASNNMVNTDHYSFESGLILTNLTVCKIRYVRDVTSVITFDPLFKNLLATCLAFELTKYFNDSASFREGLLKEIELLKRDCYGSDSFQASLQAVTMPI